MGGLTFTLGTMLTSIIMTAILLHTRGSILVAVIYHWLINATPRAVSAMFPDIDREASNVDLVSDLGVKAVIVIIFIMLLGKNLTRNKRSNS
jgi:membrane protease YdiL (CAAX protease family)